MRRVNRQLAWRWIPLHRARYGSETRKRRAGLEPATSSLGNSRPRSSPPDRQPPISPASQRDREALLNAKEKAVSERSASAADRQSPSVSSFDRLMLTPQALRACPAVRTPATMEVPASESTSIAQRHGPRAALPSGELHLAGRHAAETAQPAQRCRKMKAQSNCIETAIRVRAHR
jgi:hypothetical protein